MEWKWPMVETGYFLCGAGHKKFPARIERTCSCTVNGGDVNTPHDWRESCDRFQRFTADIAGDEANPEHVWKNSTPLEGQGGLTPVQEYEFRCAQLAHVAQHGKPNLRAIPPIAP